MTTELKTFTYDFDTTGDFAHLENFDIRVVTLNDKPWFVARDVCILLGYANPTESVRRYCKYSESVKGERFSSLALGLHPQTKLIPESDLYRLVMRSNMEEAERFQDWVCEDVLPTIRQTGGTYMTPEHVEKAIMNPDFIIKMATKIKDLQAERDEARLAEEEHRRFRNKINEGRAASAMQKAGTLAKRVKKLEAQLEAQIGGDDYLAVSSIKWINQFFRKVGRTWPHQIIGYDLKKLSDELGHEVKEVHDDRYGKVNRYHKDVVDMFEVRVERHDVRPCLVKYLRWV